MEEFMRKLLVYASTLSAIKAQLDVVSDFFQYANHLLYIAMQGDELKLMDEAALMLENCQKSIKALVEHPGEWE